MDGGEITTSALTAALVLITAYYAVQNRKMVEEMRAARSVQVLPRLVLALHGITTTKCLVRLANVGPGPALGVLGEVTFMPARRGVEVVRRPLRVDVLTSGEHLDFLPPGSPIPDLAQLGADYQSVVMSVRFTDALGNLHDQVGGVTEILKWQEIRSESRVRWQHPDFERRLAAALQEKFGAQIDRQLRDLGRIIRVIDGLAPRAPLWRGLLHRAYGRRRASDQSLVGD